MPRNTLTWKKYIWKFNCSTSRPFQKGSVYKVLPIFEVCIFISKTELWKNTAPARRSCLLAHVEPFFHFQNSVGDHTLYYTIYIYVQKHIWCNHTYIFHHCTTPWTPGPSRFQPDCAVTQQRLHLARSFRTVRWGWSKWVVIMTKTMELYMYIYIFYVFDTWVHYINTYIQHAWYMHIYIYMYNLKTIDIYI